MTKDELRTWELRTMLVLLARLIDKAHEAASRGDHELAKAFAREHAAACRLFDRLRRRGRR